MNNEISKIRRGINLRDPDPLTEMDRLDRAGFGEQLSQRLHLLEEGAAICIHAPWGDGKTHFALNWAKRLQEQGYTTGYVDAFQADYLDDPFLVIAAALRTAIKANTPAGSATVSTLTNRMAEIATTLVPTAARFAVNTAGILLGAPGLGSGVEAAMNTAVEAVGTLGEKAVEERLEELSDLSKQTTDLTIALKNCVSDLDKKPLVFLIDELDRCNPLFAIRLLERIKHYFECEGVVFVFFADTEQLQKSISHSYGVDGIQYLNKFFDIQLSLPRRPVRNYNLRKIENSEIILASFQRLPPNISQRLNESRELLTLITSVFGMSLRDVKRVIFSLALCAGDISDMPLACYLACLRVSHPSIYRALRLGKPDGHKRNLELLESLLESTNLAKWLKALHQLALNMNANTEAEARLQTEVKTVTSRIGDSTDQLHYLRYVFNALEFANVPSD